MTSDAHTRFPFRTPRPHVPTGNENERSLRTRIVALVIVAAFAVLSAPLALAQGKAAQVIDVSGRNGVDGSCVVTGFASAQYGCHLYTVPAGKVLVVRTVGFRMVGVSIPEPLYALFGRPGLALNLGNPKTYVFNVPPPVVSGTFRVHAANHLTEFTLDENESLDAFTEFGVNAPNLLGVFTFFGYLIDR